MIKCAILGSCALLASLSPAAHANSSAEYFRERAAETSIPAQLDSADRVYYTDLFAAIDAKDWAKAQALIASRPSGSLHSIAKAELYLAANSPRVEMGPLLALLQDAPDIPQAEQLGRLATTRGATLLPDRAQVRQLASFAPAPRRGKPRSIADSSMPAETSAAILERIKNDDPIGAEALLLSADPLLTPDARTEWQQRVAWSYYIENDDTSAFRLARQAIGGSGAWLGESYWTLGLAAWRLNDCANAAYGFGNAASNGDSDEARAAGYYWASRAQLRCRAPDKVQANLRSAATFDETVYGILANEALGVTPPVRAAADFSDSDWNQLKRLGNVRAAIALNEIGKSELADEMLRYQAKLGDDADYAPMLRLARDLSLPATQLWMARNGPYGVTPDSFARYPSPKWMPAGGWRVDPALVFAHTMQESAFQIRAASPAGAYGLMQVRPIAAKDIDRRNGKVSDTSIADLYQPSVNLEYGQSYLEQLRDLPQTQGLLPKIIAAYNAGPTPVERWNVEVRDNGDPLLFIESIPYWETRGYVGTILRNYWMYERQANVASQSATGLAQGLWPSFPDGRSMKLVRLSGAGGTSHGY